VQGRDEFGLLVLQLDAEQFREEVMITIPLPPFVERYEEEVRALNVAENFVRSPVSRTASQSEPEKRSRIEVLRRNVATSPGWLRITCSPK
jgi:hypothetical protein